MKRKHTTITITLTPEEARRIRVAAAWSGQTVSAFIRHIVLPIVAEIEDAQIGNRPVWTTTHEQE